LFYFLLQYNDATGGDSNWSEGGSRHAACSSVFERLDDAIAFLLHELGVSVVQLKTRADVYEYLHSVSKTLAESVYKKKILTLDCLKKYVLYHIISFV
jgi:hypothetical protein